MNKEFEVHMLNEDGKNKAKNIAILFDDLVNHLGLHIFDSSYMSIVKNKLEEACFFAKKGMAVMEENQQK